MAHGSATPAIHVLRKHGVRFSEHPYRYEEHGGTRVSARELGVDEHVIVKTLVMEDGGGRPLLVLMHGDREVSTKQFARQDTIYINGGRRGLLVAIAPQELVRVLGATPVNAAI